MYDLLIAFQNAKPGNQGMFIASVIEIAIIVALVFVFLVLWIYTISFGRPWHNAYLNGCPIPFTQLMGMQLRNINPNKVIPHGIAAAQAGYKIPWLELESAYLQGADLEKVVAAYVTSMKRDQGFTFSELVDADREERLAEMLNR